MSEEGGRATQRHTVASLGFANEPVFDHRGIIEAQVFFVALPLLLNSLVLPVCFKVCQEPPT